MFTQERDHFPWIVGVLIVAIVGGLQYWKARHARDRVSTAPSVQVPAPAEFPRSETAPVRRLSAPTPPPSANAATVSIYDCSNGKQRSYSDRPCAAGGVRRDLEITLNTFTSPPMVQATGAGTTSVQQTNTYEYREFRSEPAVGPGSPICEQLFDAKEQIDARMRHGYSNRQGERFRARRHQITDQIYEFRCLRGR